MGLRDYGTTGPQTAGAKAENEQARNSSDDFAELTSFLLREALAIYRKWR